MKKKLKWIGLGLVGLILVAVIGFLVWTQLTYGPTDEALENESRVEGVIFLASYPISSMVESELRVLSISGEVDGLATQTDIEASRENVPDDAVFYEIVDGNHANFGMYGPQDGDNDSPLSAKEQLDETIEQILNWL